MDDITLSGFINIDKPSDWTSHDVVAKLRNLLKIKKIGHAGTLDPFATGVLPVAIGSAARLIRFLKKSKRYIAELNFTGLTDTDDITGEELDIETIKEVFTELNLKLPSKQWTEETLALALKKFEGEVEQTPPLYSAIRHNGKKLYELMRSGEGISLSQVKKRQVKIHEIKLLSFNFPYAQIDISCAEGTYIRSIARDLGAHLSKLRRVESNGFDIDSSITIEELQDILSGNDESFTLNDLLVNSHEIVDLPLIEFNPKEALDLQQGKRLVMDNLSHDDIENLENSEFIQCLDQSQELIGIGSVSKRRGDSLLVQPKVIL